MVRNLVLGGSLLLILLLAVATVADLIRNGPTGLGIVSIAVLALLGFGVGGAIAYRDPHE